MTRTQKILLFGGGGLVLLYLLSRSKSVQSAAGSAIEAAKKLAFSARDPTDKVLATLAADMQPLARKFVEQARAAVIRSS